MPDERITSQPPLFPSAAPQQNPAPGPTVPSADDARRRLMARVPIWAAGCCFLAGALLAALIAAAFRPSPPLPLPEDAERAQRKVAEAVVAKALQGAKQERVDESLAEDRRRAELTIVRALRYWIEYENQLKAERYDDAARSLRSGVLLLETISSFEALSFGDDGQDKLENGKKAWLGLARGVEGADRKAIADIRKFDADSRAFVAWAWKMTDPHAAP